MGMARRVTLSPRLASPSHGDPGEVGRYSKRFIQRDEIFLDQQMGQEDFMALNYSIFPG